MLETTGLFALEYDPQTNTSRINDLELVLKHNLGCLAKGEAGNSYVILAISESRQELRKFSQSVMKQKDPK